MNDSNAPDEMKSRENAVKLLQDLIRIPSNKGESDVVLFLAQRFERL